MEFIKSINGSSSTAQVNMPQNPEAASAGNNTLPSSNSNKTDENSLTAFSSDNIPNFDAAPYDRKITNAKKEIMKYEKEIIDFEKKIKEQEEKIEKLNKEIKTTQTKIQELQKQISFLNTESKDYEDKKSEIENEIGTLNGELGNLISQLDTAVNTRANLEKRKADAGEKLNKANLNYNDAINEKETAKLLAIQKEEERKAAEAASAAAANKGGGGNFATNRTLSDEEYNLIGASDPELKSRIDMLVPSMRNRLVEMAKIAASEGISINFNAPDDIFRTYEEQVALQSTGLAAAPGSSPHEFGRAVDIQSDNRERLGEIWRSLGGTWGISVGSTFESWHFQDDT